MAISISNTSPSIAIPILILPFASCHLQSSQECWLPQRPSLVRSISSSPLIRHSGEWSVKWSAAWWHRPITMRLDSPFSEAKAFRGYPEDIFASYLGVHIAIKECGWWMSSMSAVITVASKSSKQDVGRLSIRTNTEVDHHITSLLDFGIRIPIFKPRLPFWTQVWCGVRTISRVPVGWVCDMHGMTWHDMLGAVMQCSAICLACLLPGIEEHYCTACAFPRQGGATGLPTFGKQANYHCWAQCCAYPSPPPDNVPNAPFNPPKGDSCSIASPSLQRQLA